jgi:hypothetical protein
VCGRYVARVVRCQLRPAWEIDSAAFDKLRDNFASQVHARVPEVRFFNRLWLRPIGFEKRTSGAEEAAENAGLGKKAAPSG